MVHNFWYNDISIIYNKQFILEFLPLKNYSLTRKLNAVLRFSILYSIIIFIINREKSVFCFPLIIMIITMIIYNHNNPKNLDTINNFVNMNEPKYQSDSNLYPNLDNNIQYLIDGINTSCILPTENNPFMNNLFFTEASNKEPCTPDDNASINSLMNSNLMMEYISIVIIYSLIKITHYDNSFHYRMVESLWILLHLLIGVMVIIILAKKGMYMIVMEALMEDVLL